MDLQMNQKILIRNENGWWIEATIVQVYEHSFMVTAFLFGRKHFLSYQDYEENFGWKKMSVK